MEFRIATAADAAEISGIYSRYIGTPVTFEYTLPDAGEFALRIQKTLERYPYLVAVEAGKIRGYASAHRFQARAAYQWGAELSIYLEPAATSRGIGGRLYALLIALLAKQGIRTVYGCVTIPNPASE